MVIIITTLLSITASLFLFLSIERLGGICKLAFLLPIIFLLLLYATEPEYQEVSVDVYDSGIGKYAVLDEGKFIRISDEYSKDTIKILIPKSQNPFYGVRIEQ